MSVDVAGALADVRARVAAAARRSGREPGVVRVVGVSKLVDEERMRAGVAAGLTDLGENRAQDLVAKARHLEGLGITWHFVGQLQRNKVRMLAPHVSWWHSVDRSALVAPLARHADGARVLVQVDHTGREGRGGAPPDAVPALVDELREAGVPVVGLMTVPAPAVDPRPTFAAVRALGSRLGLPELSMGMSDDYEIAIEEGATMVRVGRAVFGARPAP